jgi:hypothetical protein
MRIETPGRKGNHRNEHPTNFRMADGERGGGVLEGRTPDPARMGQNGKDSWAQALGDKAHDMAFSALGVGRGIERGY